MADFDHDSAVQLDDEPDPESDSAHSGTRAAPTVSARLEAALAASARTEAALGDVFRTTKFLSATINGLREANAALARELESLSATISSGGDERSAVAGRIHRLDRVVDEAEDGALRERERLVTEHDKFIEMLLADHERDLEALRRRAAEIEEKQVEGEKS